MNVVGAISLLVAVGGVIGALVAAFKLQPERNQIKVTTAEGLVVMQSRVLEAVNAELDECQRDRKAMREQLIRLEQAARAAGWDL